MLTPDKIKNKTFQTTGKGSYRAEDVDSFMEEVSASYEQVFRENGEIIRKMSILANKVEEYKKDEDSLRQALLSAQKLADQITSEAKQNADKTLSEAQTKAQEIISEAQQSADKLMAQTKSVANETVFNANKQAEDILGTVNRKVTQEKLVFEMMQREVSAFKAKMMDMYKEHLTLLDRLPGLAEEEAAAIQENEKADEAEKAEAEVEQTEAAAAETAEEEATEEDVTQEEGAAEDEPAEDEDDEEILTYDPAAVFDGEDEEEAEKDSDDDGFILDESFFEDGIDDTGDSDDEPDVTDVFSSGEGFSLTLDDDDLDEDEFDEEEEDADADDSDEDDGDGDNGDESDSDGDDSFNALASEYASADDEQTDDDDDDNGGFSFRGFFKKK